ncbi:MAG: cytochrome c [Methylococcaceae bacterium]
MKKILGLFLISLVIPACVKNSFQGDSLSKNSAITPNPTAQQGARVFQQRCELCHGSKGMGEGALALTLKNYPDTNLLLPKYQTDTDSLRQQIIFGGSRGKMHQFSPPWGDELTWTEIESVTLFITQLRESPEVAFKLLRKEDKHQKPTLKLGRLTFKNRCALCHGPDGEGNGKMARIIKDPPPFNLTYSMMPDAYLKDMISKGGQKMQRSSRMPPFGGDLSVNEINSVVAFIKTLRISN